MANFQFPICILSIDEPKLKYNLIIDFSIVNEACKVPDDAIESDKYNIETYPEGFDPGNILHRKICFVSDRKNVRLGSVKGVIGGHKKAESYINDFKRKNFTKNKNCLWTKLPTTITFQARDKEYDRNKALVLAAVNGILGNNALYKRITIKRIQAAAEGYKSHKILPDKIKTLPYQKTRRITDRLEVSGWFIKYTYNNRVTYYSTRIKEIETLIRKVETKHARKSQKSKKELIKEKVINELKNQ